MMTKMIVLGLVASSTLAAAQPTPAQPPQPPMQSVRFSLTVKSGADTRTYELVMSDRGCGTVEEKAAAYADDVRVCSVPAPNGLSLEIEGMTRAGATEYRQRAQVVLARKGGSVEVGRTGGMRFALKTL